MTLRWTDPEQLADDWRDGLLGPGKMFELVTEDVLGTPVEVFAQRPRSLVEVIERSAEAHHDRAFLIGPEDTVTFGDMPARMAEWAAVLADGYGVRAGDRVLLAGRISFEHCMAIWAVVWLGAVATTTNPGWTRDELAHALELTDPTVAVVDAAVVERLADSGVPTLTFDELASRVTDGVAAPKGEIAEDDPFTIIFTSGTTGRPKGAALTHRNSIQFSLAAAVTSAVHGIVNELPPAGGPSVSMCAAPLFHISGMLGQLTNGAFWGISQVIAPPGRWDETVHLELTEQHRVTGWALVPTQLWRLIEHPRFEEFDLSSLAVVGGGGATFPPELLRRTAERLPHVSTALRVGYGMTETAGPVTMLQPPVDDQRRASVGQPVAGAEVEIRDPQGEPVPDGSVGEIWARTAQVFLGYWNDEKATDAALDAQRWYATGDYGRIEDGYLYLESRLRDMIIRGGENIYPIEIENRLIEHPDIAEVAVVGVEHPTLGQEVKAVIVLRGDARPTDDEIRAWAGETLARHKVPAHIEIRDELPRNDTGKVLKRELA